MPGTQVRSLVWEDPTCCGAAKPMRHNDWAHTPQQEKSLQWEARALQLEKACAQQRRPNAAKNK